jgi:hypothetical protein
MLWRIAFMKSTIQRALFAVAVVTLGAGAIGTASAQQASSAPNAVPQPGEHRGHFRHFGGPFVGPLLRATKQMNLSATQQASIKSILVSAHHAHQPGTAPEGPSLTVLGNPADPSYAAAVQTEQAKAQVRIQQETTLAGQIYAVLTSQQQQQLPAVLASLQAQQQARRAQWAAKHAGGNS